MSGNAVLAGDNIAGGEAEPRVSAFGGIAPTRAPEMQTPSVAKGTTATPAASPQQQQAQPQAQAAPKEQAQPPVVAGDESLTADGLAAAAATADLIDEQADNEDARRAKGGKGKPKVSLPKWAQKIMKLPEGQFEPARARSMRFYEPQVDNVASQIEQRIDPSRAPKLYDADGGGIGIDGIETPSLAIAFQSRADLSEVIYAPRVSDLDKGMYRAYDIFTGKTLGDVIVGKKGEARIYNAGPGMQGMWESVQQSFMTGAHNAIAALGDIGARAFDKIGDEDKAEWLRRFADSQAETAGIYANDKPAFRMTPPIVNEDGSVTITTDTVANLVAEAVPSLFVSIGAGKTLGQVGKVGGKVGSKLGKSGEEFFTQQRVAAMQRKSEVGGAIFTNMALGGGQVGLETRERLQARTDLSDEEKQKREDAAAMLGMAFGYVTGRFAHGGKGGIVPGMFRESFQEAVEESGQTLIAATTAGDPLTGREMAESAIAGAIGGAGAGGIASGGQGLIRGGVNFSQRFWNVDTPEDLARSKELAKEVAGGNEGMLRGLHKLLDLRHKHGEGWLALGQGKLGEIARTVEGKVKFAQARAAYIKDAASAAGDEAEETTGRINMLIDHALAARRKNMTTAEYFLREYGEGKKEIPEGMPLPMPQEGFNEYLVRMSATADRELRNATGYIGKLTEAQALQMQEQIMETGTMTLPAKAAAVLGKPLQVRAAKSDEDVYDPFAGGEQGKPAAGKKPAKASAEEAPAPAGEPETPPEQQQQQPAVEEPPAEAPPPAQEEPPAAKPAKAKKGEGKKKPKADVPPEETPPPAAAPESEAATAAEEGEGESDGEVVSPPPAPSQREGEKEEEAAPAGEGEGAPEATAEVKGTGRVRNVRIEGESYILAAQDGKATIISPFNNLFQDVSPAPRAEEIALQLVLKTDEGITDDTPENEVARREKIKANAQSIAAQIREELETKDDTVKSRRELEQSGELDEEGAPESPPPAAPAGEGEGAPEATAEEAEDAPTPAPPPQAGEGEQETPARAPEGEDVVWIKTVSEIDTRGLHGGSLIAESVDVVVSGDENKSAYKFEYGGGNVYGEGGWKLAGKADNAPALDIDLSQYEDNSFATTDRLQKDITSKLKAAGYKFDDDKESPTPAPSRGEGSGEDAAAALGEQERLERELARRMRALTGDKKRSSSSSGKGKKKREKSDDETPAARQSLLDKIKALSEKSGKPISAAASILNEAGGSLAGLRRQGQTPHSVALKLIAGIDNLEKPQISETPILDALEGVNISVRTGTELAIELQEGGVDERLFVDVGGRDFLGDVFDTGADEGGDARSVASSRFAAQEIGDDGFVYHDAVVDALLAEADPDRPPRWSGDERRAMADFLAETDFLREIEEKVQSAGIDISSVQEGTGEWQNLIAAVADAMGIDAEAEEEGKGGGALGDVIDDVFAGAEEEAASESEADVEDDVSVPDGDIGTRAVARLREYSAGAANIVDALDGGRVFKNKEEIFAAADVAANKGEYDGSDYKWLWEQVELANNFIIIRDGIATVDDAVKLWAKYPKTMQSGKRDAEQDQHQQFSTPLPLAAAAALATGMGGNEVGLEPSAGNAGLASFLPLRQTRVNEIDKGRLASLRALGDIFGPWLSVTDVEAHRFVRNKWKDGVDIVLMNPPFSHSAGRANSSKVTDEHVANALSNVRKGGRAVIITGENWTPGAATHRAAFTQLFKKGWTMRASVWLDGALYQQYGAGFPVRMTVMDLTGDGTDREAPIVSDQIHQQKDGKDWEQLAEVIKKIPARAPRQDGDLPPPEEPASAPAAEAGGEGEAEAESRPSPAPSSLPSPRVPPAQVTGDEDSPPAEESENTGGTVTKREVARGKLREGVPPIPLREGAVKNAPNDDSVTVPYESKFAGPKTMVPLQTTRNLSAVELPDVGLGARFDDGTSFLRDGNADGFEMFAVQEQEVHYFVESTREWVDMPTESGGTVDDATVQARAGYLSAMGTGVGKTVVGVGAIKAGRKLGWGGGRAIVVSAKKGLLGDGAADRNKDGEYTVGLRKGAWQMGLDADSFIRGKRKSDSGDGDFRKFGENETLFFTYDDIKNPEDKKESALPADYSGANVYNSRLRYLKEQLPPDWDGVIVLDEAHLMGNAFPKGGDWGMDKPSSQGIAGVALQQMFPKARVLYLTATPFKDSGALGYATRLGMVGGGAAPFRSSRDLAEFAADLGNLGAEMIALDLKATGRFNQAELSWRDVTIEQPVIQLSDVAAEQRAVSAHAWAVVAEGIKNNIDRVIEELEPDPEKREKMNLGRVLSDMRRRLTQDRKRFFKFFDGVQKAYYIADDAVEKIRAGDKVVVSVNATDDAAMKRAVQRQVEAQGKDKTDKDFDWSLVDMTPVAILLNAIRRAIDVRAYEIIDVEVTDPATGRKKTEQHLIPLMRRHAAFDGNEPVVVTTADGNTPRSDQRDGLHVRLDNPNYGEKGKDGKKDMRRYLYEALDTPLGENEELSALSAGKGANIVTIDRASVEARDDLIQRTEDALAGAVPENPIDIVKARIASEFGPGAVGEMSGRGVRRVFDTDDWEENVRYKDVGSHDKITASALAAWHEGKIELMVISENVAGTGYDLPIARDAKTAEGELWGLKLKKDGKPIRAHAYLLSMGDRADLTIQTIGRTHRSNEASSPNLIIPSLTAVTSQMQSALIASKIAKLGAFSTGSKKGMTKGIFTEEIDIFDEYLTDAIQNFALALNAGVVEGVDMSAKAFFVDHPQGLQTEYNAANGNWRNFRVNPQRFINFLDVAGPTNISALERDAFATRVADWVKAERRQIVANLSDDQRKEVLNYKKDKLNIRQVYPLNVEGLERGEVEFVKVREQHHQGTPPPLREGGAWYRRKGTNKLYWMWAGEHKFGGDSESKPAVFRQGMPHDNPTAQQEKMHAPANYRKLKGKEIEEANAEWAELAKKTEYTDAERYFLRGRLLRMHSRTPKGTGGGYFNLLPKEGDAHFSGRQLMFRDTKGGRAEAAKFLERFSGATASAQEEAMTPEMLAAAVRDDKQVLVFDGGRLRTQMARMDGKMRLRVYGPGAATLNKLKAKSWGLRKVRVGGDEIWIADNDDVTLAAITGTKGARIGDDGDGERFALVGESAAPATILAQLKSAKQLYERAGGNPTGADLDYIWKTTRFIRGADGQFRFEIDDLFLRESKFLEFAKKTDGAGVRLEDLTGLKAGTVAGVLPEVLDMKLYVSVAEGDKKATAKFLPGHNAIIMQFYAGNDAAGEDAAVDADTPPAHKKGDGSVAELPGGGGRDAGPSGTVRAGLLYGASPFKGVGSVGQSQEALSVPHRRRVLEGALARGEPQALLAHEIQHWVQYETGLAIGGTAQPSPNHQVRWTLDEFDGASRHEQFEKLLEADVQKEQGRVLDFARENLEKLSASDAEFDDDAVFAMAKSYLGYRRYYRSAGEAEAREVAARAGKDARWRADNPPRWGGYAEEDLEVLFEGDLSSYIFDGFALDDDGGEFLGDIEYPVPVMQMEDGVVRIDRLPLRERSGMPIFGELRGIVRRAAREGDVRNATVDLYSGIGAQAVERALELSPALARDYLHGLKLGERGWRRGRDWRKTLSALAQIDNNLEQAKKEKIPVPRETKRALARLLRQFADDISAGGKSGVDFHIVERVNARAPRSVMGSFDNGGARAVAKLAMNAATDGNIGGLVETTAHEVGGHGTYDAFMDITAGGGGAVLYAMVRGRPGFGEAMAQWKADSVIEPRARRSADAWRDARNARYEKAGEKRRVTDAEYERILDSEVFSYALGLYVAGEYARARGKEKQRRRKFTARRLLARIWAAVRRLGRRLLSAGMTRPWQADSFFEFVLSGDAAREIDARRADDEGGVNGARYAYIFDGMPVDGLEFVPIKDSYFEYEVMLNGDKVGRIVYNRWKTERGSGSQWTFKALPQYMKKLGVFGDASNLKFPEHLPQNARDMVAIRIRDYLARLAEESRGVGARFAFDKLVGAQDKNRWNRKFSVKIGNRTYSGVMSGRKDPADRSYLIEELRSEDFYFGDTDGGIVDVFADERLEAAIDARRQRQVAVPAGYEAAAKQLKKDAARLTKALDAKVPNK